MPPGAPGGMPMPPGMMPMMPGMGMGMGMPGLAMPGMMMPGMGGMPMQLPGERPGIARKCPCFQCCRMCGACGTWSRSEDKGTLQGCRSGVDLVGGYGGAATPAETSSDRGIEGVLREVAWSFPAGAVQVSERVRCPTA